MLSRLAYQTAPEHTRAGSNAKRAPAQMRTPLCRSRYQPAKISDL